MNYKVGKINNIEWAVFKGNSATNFVHSSITISKREAERYAIVLTAKWHQREINKCRESWNNSRRRSRIDTIEDGQKWENMLCINLPMSNLTIIGVPGDFIVVNKDQIVGNAATRSLAEQIVKDLQAQ